MPRGVLVVRAGGFGFVQTAEGEYFIPQSKLHGAFDGDLVEVAPLPVRSSGKKTGKKDCESQPAARIVRVVDRAHDSIVGRYEVADPFGVVVPEDSKIPYDIFTMRADYPDIEHGALVRVRLTNYPNKNTAATGVIEEVLGTAKEAAMGIDAIIARHKIETTFSEAALLEAKRATVDVDRALLNGYVDIRNRTVFTIDPETAKDFDDALSISPVVDDSKAAWKIGVHIADVSHYVPWNSSIDLDARRRATSVYLADRVIPMIPEDLSNSLCSLEPLQNRRCMTVDIYVDEYARLVRARLYPAIMRSSVRLTYDQVQEVFDGDPSSEKAKELEPLLLQLSRLAQYRQKSRLERGGIEFSSIEAKAVLGEDGRAIDVSIRKKTQATSLVEEMMIFANEVVADYLETAAFPCLYRVHERPSSDSLADLIPVFEEYSWFERIDSARFILGDGAEIERVLELAKGRAEEFLVSSLCLRAMKRADYRPENFGHFGLASESYAHFTSPIRRYPDLVVHRMLKAFLFGKGELFDQEASALKWIGEHSSEMERIADECSRESHTLKIIEYLQDYIGTAFSGVVSGVANFGLYVQLENTAEGVLPMRCLGQEYFSFDPDRYTLTGQDTNKVYRLGQRVAVVLSIAEPHTRRLEFKLAGSR